VGGSLDMDRDPIGPGFGEQRDHFGRIVHHEVYVERQRRGLLQGGDQSRPNVSIGTKWPSMTSIWMRSAPASPRSGRLRRGG
jgi:hypothetical protein